MRSITTVFALLIAILPCSAQTNAIDRFFSAYENNENFTVVYV